MGPQSLFLRLFPAHRALTAQVTELERQNLELRCGLAAIQDGDFPEPGGIDIAKNLAAEALRMAGPVVIILAILSCCAPVPVPPQPLRRCDPRLSLADRLDLEQGEKDLKELRALSRP